MISTTRIIGMTAGVACLVAFGFAVIPGEQIWSVTVQTQTAHAKDRSDTDHDLTRMALLNRTVIHLKENYVDPKRIDETAMLVAALEAVQEEIDDVLVDIIKDEKSKPIEAKIHVGSTSLTYSLEGVTSLWQMSFKLKDIFRFIATNAAEIKSQKDVEYAAINGLLSTLDPHSVLLRPPEVREMRLSTNGQFGGLGIIIQVEDGRLVVVRPIPKTPAARAGVKAGDRIVQIGLDSTMNMTTDDAVELLRGEPNTHAEIWITRKGWARKKKFKIRRAIIDVDSVFSRRLKNGVGLIRIDHFQSSTYDELKTALKKLKRGRKTLKGLILDLRGNPGGLLNQAVKVADQFIVSGPVVTTVGYGEKMRQPKMATRESTEENLSIAVLIDSSSASASEIVAGALKNHDRAILIGQQSFGKGSVQVIYDNLDDSALKLTIAQYLTPGDQSIQSVGVTPDIETVPILVEEDEIDLFSDWGGGEGKLHQHLAEDAQATAKETARYRMPYLRDVSLEEKMNKDFERLQVDFEVRLAADVLTSTRELNREVILDQAEDLIVSRTAKAERNIIQALNKRGVDWSKNDDIDAGAEAAIEVKTNLRDGRVRAGQTLEVTVTVRNTGRSPFLRLAAMTESADPQADDREFVFGRIEPGMAKSWTTKFEFHTASRARDEMLKISFKSLGKRTPAPYEVRYRVEPLERPTFTMSYRIDDTRSGNGDGLLQQEETVDLVMRVRRMNDAPVKELLGVLRNDGRDEDRKVFVERGRIEQTWTPDQKESELRFRLRTKPAVTGPIRLETAVFDTDTGAQITGYLEIVATDKRRRLKSKRVRIDPGSSDGVVRSHYSRFASALAELEGTVTAYEGPSGWYRVELDNGHYGWIERPKLSEEGATEGRIKWLPTQVPVTFRMVDEPPLVTADDSVTVAGQTSGSQLSKDVRIYLNRRKIYFQPRASKDRTEPLNFRTRLALKKGVNRVDVLVRSEGDFTDSKTFWVRRLDNEK